MKRVCGASALTKPWTRRLVSGGVLWGLSACKIYETSGKSY